MVYIVAPKKHRYANICAGTQYLFLKKLFQSGQDNEVSAELGVHRTEAASLFKRAPRPLSFPRSSSALQAGEVADSVRTEPQLNWMCAPPQFRALEDFAPHKVDLDDVTSSMMTWMSPRSGCISTIEAFWELAKRYARKWHN